jgi:hypothetical protein
MIAGSAFGLFFVYWACAGLSAWLAGRFGSRWGLSGEAPLGTRAGFVVLLFAISVAGFVLEPVSNTFGRYFEHQADVYGQEAIHGIVPDPQKTAVAAFNALGAAWLVDAGELCAALRSVGQRRARTVLRQVAAGPRWDGLPRVQSGISAKKGQNPRKNVTHALTELNLNRLILNLLSEKSRAKGGGF